MAVSKRTRFEVLRRDGHTCRYCGGRAPDVHLTVDHVIPTALGGSDDPSNLVAACRDCNAGKSSSSPDEAIVAQVSEDAIRWAAAMKLASQRAAENRQAQLDRVRPFWEFWTECTETASPWTRPRYELPAGWESSIAGLLNAGMAMREVLEAAVVTMGRQPVPDNAFRYAMGVANKMLERIQADARQLITDGAV